MVLEITSWRWWFITSFFPGGYPSHPQPAPAFNPEGRPRAEPRMFRILGTRATSIRRAVVALRKSTNAEAENGIFIRQDSTHLTQTALRVELERYRNRTPASAKANRNKMATGGLAVTLPRDGRQLGLLGPKKPGGGSTAATQELETPSADSLHLFFHGGSIYSTARAVRQLSLDSFQTAAKKQSCVRTLASPLAAEEERTRSRASKDPVDMHGSIKVYLPKPWS